MMGCILISSAVVLLIVACVHCDQEEQASKNQTKNSVSVIEFPIDQVDDQTFVSIKFSPKLQAEVGDAKTFTLCFSLMIDAFKYGNFDNWQIFQVLDKDESIVTSVQGKALVDPDFPTQVLFYDKNDTLLTFFPFEGRFLLSSWLQICFSSNTGKLMIGDGIENGPPFGDKKVPEVPEGNITITFGDGIPDGQDLNLAKLAKYPM